LFLLTAASACGPAGSEDSSLNRYAYPRIPNDYHGWAICTGEPYLNVREYPYASSVISGNKARCEYGESAYVEGLEWDSESQQYYARLPGWGSNGTDAFADWRWLEVRQ
jgi:hypothetical protein